MTYRPVHYRGGDHIWGDNNKGQISGKMQSLLCFSGVVNRFNKKFTPMQGLPVFSEEDDICKLSNCPIPKGKFETTFSKHFPIYTPPGKHLLFSGAILKKEFQPECIRTSTGSYTTKIVSRDGKGDMLTCLEIKFSVKLLSQS